ncbi:hypothetical protein [Streptomyces sp. NPDC059788]|uniref:hypothetical protein n=1 Tax=Streptomyces sp. NPDC059788 TaxID=3346948 RepID=UPI0036496DB3
MTSRPGHCFRPAPHGAYQLAAARWRLADPQHGTLGHHLHAMFDDLHSTARSW